MTNLVKFSITLSLVLLIDNVHADREAFESTYAPLAPEKIIIQNASVYDGDGGELLETDILVDNGKIIAIGKDLPFSNEFRGIDATGKWVTPGIIDIHSHMGVYPAPGVRTSSD